MTFQPGIYRKVLSLLPKDRNLRILDVGAGEGYFTHCLRAAGYTDLTGCDFVDWKLSDVPFKRADLNAEIPFESDSFDCVVSIEVIEHIEHHARFIAELMRVTRPNGMILITTPNTLTIEGRWHSAIFGFNDCAPLPLEADRDDWYLQHVNPIGLPRLLFNLERAGAELVELHTNRYRRMSSLLYYPVLPVLALALRLKLLRAKYAEQRELYSRYLHWMLSKANLCGRITMAIARKRQGTVTRVSISARRPASG